VLSPGREVEGNGCLSCCGTPPFILDLGRRRPHLAGANFFLYAWTECEWVRIYSCMRGWNAIGREQNASRHGRVEMDED
jgi:hypothetical protein